MSALQKGGGWASAPLPGLGGWMAAGTSEQQCVFVAVVRSQTHLFRKQQQQAPRNRKQTGGCQWRGLGWGCEMGEGGQSKINTSWGCTYCVEPAVNKAVAEKVGLQSLQNKMSNSLW